MATGTIKLGMRPHCSLTLYSLLRDRCKAAILERDGVDGPLQRIDLESVPLWTVHQDFGVRRIRQATNDRDLEQLFSISD